MTIWAAIAGEIYKSLFLYKGMVPEWLPQPGRVHKRAQWVGKNGAVDRMFAPVLREAIP
jgi:hypothetical protein